MTIVPQLFELTLPNPRHDRKGTPYSVEHSGRIAWLLGTVEDSPVQQAVVDYLGMVDADGMVTPETPVTRRFGVRDLRHVEIYKLRVVRLNAVARVRAETDRQNRGEKDHDT